MICDRRAVAKVKGKVFKSEASNVVWFYRAGGSRVKDLEILFVRDEDRKDLPRGTAQVRYFIETR